MSKQYDIVSITNLDTLNENINKNKTDLGTLNTSLGTLTTNFNNHNHDSLYCKAVLTGNIYTIS